MSSTVATGTILDQIIARTTIDAAYREASVPAEQLADRAARLQPPVSLIEALSAPGISVISEVKRASPSRGVFPVEVVPAQVAAEYLTGGAAAISVLTDEPYFKGSLHDLEVVAGVAHGWPRPAPVLRKDFMVNAYQVVEARAFGADVILLIVAALTDEALLSLYQVATDLKLDVLVEVHDEAEMARAAALGARLIGINNRDLHTFNVDLATTERLAALAPAGTLLVSESGIFTPADVARVAAAGASAILVGESLIVAPDRAAAVQALRAPVSA